MSIRRRAALLSGALLCLSSPALAAPIPAAPPQAVPAKPAAKAPKPAAAAKSAQARKASAKPGKKKTTAKAKMKNGRAAVSTRPADAFDSNQLALEHLDGAGTKSVLDLLSSYKETLAEGDLETAGVLLRLATGGAPDHALVTSVNDLIDARLNTDDTEILVEIARAPRAGAAAQDASGGSSPPSPRGDRIQSAHAATANAPASSRIGGLIAYRLAVAGNNAEAAALALASVLRRSPDEAAVAKANTLLGLGSGMPAAKILAAMPSVRTFQ